MFKMEEDKEFSAQAFLKISCEMHLLDCLKLCSLNLRQLSNTKRSLTENCSVSCMSKGSQEQGPQFHAELLLELQHFNLLFELTTLAHK